MSLPGYGALVISLDFELHWGVRDLTAIDGPYRKNLIGARQAVGRILSLFEEYGIAATWATVGFLFARNRDELANFSPKLRPAYQNTRLDPYVERIGYDESDDPLHFARSLIDQIRETPHQELGSHTFSHYYCLEKGQDLEAFRSDLDSARTIAAAAGVQLRSIVLPRNQVNAEYLTAVREAGLLCYRGNQPGWMHRPEATNQPFLALNRCFRFADGLLDLSGHALATWQQLRSTTCGLVNIPASRFVPPHNRRLAKLNSLRLRRITQSMRLAARSACVYHLWWHPHNCGADVEASMRHLRHILREFVQLRDRYGYRSLCMADVAKTVCGVPA